MSGNGAFEGQGRASGAWGPARELPTAVAPGRRMGRKPARRELLVAAGLGALAGCTPGPFSEATARAAFVAVTSVNEDVWATVWTRSATALDGGTGASDTGVTDTAGAAGAAAAKGLVFEDDGAFSGTFAGPGSWTGAVEVSGTRRVVDAGGADVAYTWEMTLGYRDLVFGDVRLAGDAAWDVDATYDGGSAFLTATLLGELVGGGAAAGAGPIDTVTKVSLSGGRYTVAVTGTVGEWEVARQYDATAYAL